MLGLVLVVSALALLIRPMVGSFRSPRSGNGTHRAVPPYTLDLPSPRPPTPDQDGHPTAEVPATEVDALLRQAGLGAWLRHLTWSARVRLQHRLARRFRAGRLFLVGDAAHTHSRRPRRA